jgi:hypothetical protein
MSLNKTYSLHCDKTALILLRRERPSMDLLRTCLRDTPARDSSEEARQTARRLGWVRHSEPFPLIPSNPSVGSSVQKFDLCPNCAGELVK